MRKIVLLTALLASFTINAIAQTYYSVTHTTGVSVIGGVSVSVTNSPGRTNPTPQAFCNASPYFIGASQPGGYIHSFSPGVTHIRLGVTDFQSEDTIYLKVNGNTYPVTVAMLSDYTPCADPGGTANNMDVSNGQLVNTLGGSARRDAQVDFIFSPGFVNTLEVLHDRNNTSANGVVYGLQFALDSCTQPFVITVDSPRCKGRPIKFSATNFPNTTFTWSTTATSGSWSPSNTVYDPSYINPPFSVANVTFTCNAVRGACTYSDSKSFDIKNTPLATSITFAGPKCVGDEDTVRFLSGVGAAGGTTYIIKPNGTVQACTTAPTNDFIRLQNIQLADAGNYRGYAISNEGCVTDTLSTIVTLNPVVVADFTYNNNLGCSEDTVEFVDQSLGSNYWTWTFGDGNSSIDQNPINIYSAQGTYTVKLVTGNSGCKDSVEKLVALTHPLTADIAIVDDKDSICQGETITFINNSTFTPATLPQYEWDFKDGGTSSQFEPSHQYFRYGIYDVTMTITDYLGCQRTATKRVIVDSVGSAAFFSDTVICAGESIQFLGDYSEIGGTYAEWDFADGHFIRDKFTIEHAYTSPGTYLVKLTANYRICPDTTYEQNIIVKPYPTLDLGPDTSLCFDGKPFILRDLVNSGSSSVKWRWNTDTKDSTSFVTVHHPGKYAVTIEEDGCSVSDTVEVKKNCYIDIPNVFTPNGDGYNDYFLPRQLLGKGITKFSMTIFNRWGDVIFETNSINGRGWDGKVNDKDQPGGVYIYLIKASFTNGYSENYQGNVTLLR